MTRQFDPAFIHDTCSRVFWKRVASGASISDLRDQISDDHGRSLVTWALDSKNVDLWGAMSRVAESGGDREGVRAFLEAVASEAEAEVARDGNFVGQIFVDELNSGISDETPRDAIASLHTELRSLQVAEIPTMGRLCIRYPLPAVVHVLHEPTKVLLVEDTSILSGRRRHIAMFVDGIAKLPTGLGYAAHGVMYIFMTADSEEAAWRRLVPNAQYFAPGAELTVYSGSGHIRIAPK